MLLGRAEHMPIRLHPTEVARSRPEDSVRESRGRDGRQALPVSGEDDSLVLSRAELIRLYTQFKSYRAIARHLSSQGHQISHTMVGRWFQSHAIRVAELRTPKARFSEEDFRTDLRRAGLVMSDAARQRGIPGWKYRRMLTHAGISAERRGEILVEERQRRVLCDIQGLERRARRTVTSTDVVKSRTIWGRVWRSFGSWSKFDAWRRTQEAA